MTSTVHAEEADGSHWGTRGKRPPSPIRPGQFFTDLLTRGRKIPRVIVRCQLGSDSQSDDAIVDTTFIEVLEQLNATLERAKAFTNKDLLSAVVGEASDLEQNPG
ncbi:MAG: hypothetical protein AAF802_01695 [Planctomycetota bacterium]